MTAVLMALGVLLGMCALVVDVGNLYVEREELQSGADAAATAVAAACAAGNCASSAEVATQVQRAAQYANANARDGRAEVTAVCGNWGSLPSCPPPSTTLSGCLGSPSATENFVEVRVRTQSPDGSSVLPPVFASSLAGGEYQGTSVAACARMSATAAASLPAALWAGSAVGFAASLIRVNGLVHSNAGLAVTQSMLSVTSGIEYVTNLDLSSSIITAPPPKRVAAEPMPGVVTVADYRPGGSRASGAAYHAIPASSCVNDEWSVPAGAVPTGVVYVPCGVSVGGAGTVRTMLVAEGPIVFSGIAVTVAPGSAGSPALVTASSSAEAIKTAGSLVRVLGSVQAVNGGVSLTSSLSEYRCGIIADTIVITGSDTTVGMDSTCADATASGGAKFRLSG